MERKLIITLIFVTLGAIAFLGSYLLVPRFDLNQQTGKFLEKFNNNIEVELTKHSTANIIPLSSRKFISFINPLTDSQKIIAIDNSGKIIEIDLTIPNEKIIYNSQTIINEVVLSPAGDSLIYSYYDSNNNRKHTYFNFKKNISSDINGRLRAATFSPHGVQQAYILNQSDSGEILIAKGANIIKQVLKTRLEATAIDWPSEEFLSILAYDRDGYGDLFTLKEGKLLNQILSYQNDLEIKWSPSGEKMVFSNKNGGNIYDLFYRDLKNNGVITSLNTNTNASKCIWINEEEILCGVKNQSQAKDEFYKIILADGSKTLLAKPSIYLLTKELALSRSGDVLFVLNDIDNKLYALKL